MKELDDLLNQQTLKPNRELNSTFTNDVISKIRANPHPRGVRGIMYKLRTKLGILTVGAIFIVGGTAAAIALWPTPTVTRTVTQQLPSGNHIVGYNTQNCNYFGLADGSTLKQTNESVYYEVRQGSKLTDDQLQTSLQGVCEENISNNAIGAIEKLLPMSKKGDSSLAYTVNAITPSSITVSLDPHYDPTMYTLQPNQVYGHFDSAMLVYVQSTKGSLSDIHAGDTVKLITKDNSGKSSETAENYQPANHPENQTVEAILKIPALTANPDSFYGSVATDVVRAERCTSSPTGFCRAYDFADTK